MNKLKIVANVAAITLLCGALGFYNFIDKPPEVLTEVGEDCPNFIAKPFGLQGEEFIVSNDVYTLAANRGKICVVNFWETYCGTCIKELPEFDDIQEEYSDEVSVIAIAGMASTMEQLTKWLNRDGWKEYTPDEDWRDFNITFAYLVAEECLKLGAGGDIIPRTVIVDQEGKVVFAENTSMTHQSLKTIIDGLLAE